MGVDAVSFGMGLAQVAQRVGEQLCVLAKVSDFELRVFFRPHQREHNLSDADEGACEVGSTTATESRVVQNLVPDLRGRRDGLAVDRLKVRHPGRRGGSLVEDRVSGDQLLASSEMLIKLAD